MNASDDILRAKMLALCEVLESGSHPDDIGLLFAALDVYGNPNGTTTKEELIGRIRAELAGESRRMG